MHQEFERTTTEVSRTRGRGWAVLAAGLLLVAACGADEAVAPGDVSVTTTPVDEAPSTTAAGPITTRDGEATSTTNGSGLTPFPPANLDLVHGGTTWAVVLAGSVEPDGPGLSAALQSANDAGYDTGPTDCDVGAAEAVGLAGGAYTVSVYFSHEADARQAHAAFEERGVEGASVAQVSTYCMD
jgi:hypothetical protein